MCGSPIAPKNVAMMTPYVAARGCAPFVPEVRNGESHDPPEDGSIARLTGTGAPAANPILVSAPATWRHAHRFTAWSLKVRWSRTPVTVAVAGRGRVKPVAWVRSTTVACVNTGACSGVRLTGGGGAPGAR